MYVLNLVYIIVRNAVMYLTKLWVLCNFYGWCFYDHLNLLCYVKLNFMVILCIDLGKKNLYFRNHEVIYLPLHRGIQTF